MENERPNYYAIIPADIRYDNNLKDKAKLLYGEITALSDKNGYCYASNRYFAELYNVSITTISMLIKNLIDNGYIESEIIYKEGTKEILNRYLKIIKGGYLKNFKDNNTSNNDTSNNKRNKKEKIDKAILEQEFERLWSIYPNKQGKKLALKHFIEARNNGTDFVLILDGLNKYIKYCDNNKNWYSAKNGSTWFNQECWNDDYTIENNTKDFWEGL